MIFNLGEILTDLWKLLYGSPLSPNEICHEYVIVVIIMIHSKDQRRNWSSSMKNYKTNNTIIVHNVVECPSLKANSRTSLSRLCELSLLRIIRSRTFPMTQLRVIAQYSLDERVTTPLHGGIGVIVPWRIPTDMFPSHKFRTVLLLCKYFLIFVHSQQGQL